MSQILLKEFEKHGSETKTNGAVNGHRVGRKARDARGRFSRTESVRTDAGKVARRDRGKRPHANRGRANQQKVWRFPARTWLPRASRDGLLVGAFLGAGVFEMCRAFVQGLIG